MWDTFNMLITLKDTWFHNLLYFPCASQTSHILYRLVHYISQVYHSTSPLVWVLTIAHYPIPEAINIASTTRNVDCFARHSAQKPITGSESKNCCRSRFLRTVSEMRGLCTRTLMKKTQNQHLPGELSKQNWAERTELWFISIRNSSSFHMVLKIWEFCDLGQRGENLLFLHWPAIRAVLPPRKWCDLE